MEDQNNGSKQDKNYTQNVYLDISQMIHLVNI